MGDEGSSSVTVEAPGIHKSDTCTHRMCWHETCKYWVDTDPEAMQKQRGSTSAEDWIEDHCNCSGCDLGAGKLYPLDEGRRLQEDTCAEGDIKATTEFGMEASVGLGDVKFPMYNKLSDSNIIDGVEFAKMEIIEPTPLKAEISQCDRCDGCVSSLNAKTESYHKEQAKANAPEEEPPNNIGAIVAAVVISVVCLIICCVVCFLNRDKMKKKMGQKLERYPSAGRF